VSLQQDEGKGENALFQLQGARALGEGKKEKNGGTLRQPRNQKKKESTPKKQNPRSRPNAKRKKKKKDVPQHPSYSPDKGLGGKQRDGRVEMGGTAVIALIPPGDRGGG